MTPLYSFVRQIIDIPSVTGQECDLARFIERVISERGFRTELQDVEENRFNVFARTGDATARRSHDKSAIGRLFIGDLRLHYS